MSWKSLALVALLLMPVAVAHGPTTMTRTYAATGVSAGEPCLVGTSGSAVCFGASDLAYSRLELQIEDASGAAVAAELSFVRANGAPLPGSILFCGDLGATPIPEFASRALVTFPDSGCDGARATAGAVVARLYDHH